MDTQEAATDIRVQLRNHRISMDSYERSNGMERPRIRPRSASYIALRSAVYQITCLNDFNREKIGSGFFADVYKVQHKSTGEVMVLKMNKKRQNSKKMLSEIQLMNRLSHPNVLKFKGSCVHEGHLHALTEYINGGSLGDILHSSTVELSWSVRLKIARDIARGMAYLHSKGVFHRDLNSSNCLIKKTVDGKLHTIVADFGLAAEIKQRRRRSHTEVVGSPYWMAPECLNGKNYCEQADVFSYGIMLAEVLARIPADPDFMPRTQQFGMDFDALKLMCEGCPEELFELMRRCCAMDPDDRPNFEEALETLDTIHVEGDEEDNQTPVVEKNHSTLSVSQDLRSSISEPLLQIQDSDDDVRSCGSEGESRIFLLDQHVDSLSSIATSTEASGSSYGSDGGNSEDGECTVVGKKSLPFEQNGIRINVTNATLAECGTESKKSNHQGRSQETRRRRSSDGVLVTNHSSSNSHDSERTPPMNGHLPLQKSTSLNTSAKTLKRPQNLQSDSLTCSVHTLVPDELNGGGDSGIDPGEVEVFKFPPKDHCDDSILKPTGVNSGDRNGENICDGVSGDETPLCTSPSLHVTQPSPNKRLFTTTNGDISMSHTPASDMCIHVSSNNEQLTPQCTSPLAQSWTSSEFSFPLPTPSTPWAPPPSPAPPPTSHCTSRSLPTSPTRIISEECQHSPDGAVVHGETYTPRRILYHHRKTKSYSNIHDCKNVSFSTDSERQNFEIESDSYSSVEDALSKRGHRKSVHFLDDDKLCTNLDEEYFSRMDISLGASTHRRARSHSNPASIIRKRSVNSFSLTLARSSPQQQQNGTTSYSKSCKVYNIQLKRNARLSSSSPDLSVLSLAPPSV